MLSVEILINLIKAVENHPKLFINSVQSDQDDFREWTAVAEECKLSVSQAQDQWHLLLLEYVEYLRNNQDFQLAQYMDFLQPYFFTMNDPDTIDEDELLTAIDPKKIDENIGFNLVSTKHEEKTTKNFDNQDNIIEAEQKSKNNELSSLSVTKMPQTTLSTESNNQNNSFTNLSSLELIFLGYAKQLQKMPLQLQLKTKRKISDIMDEAELEMMS